MGYKLIKNDEKPTKKSFCKEHKETLIIMIVGVLVAVGVLASIPIIGMLSRRVNTNVPEEVESTNPYEKGSGEYYAYMGHEAEVTAIMDMDPLEDGTKSWYVAYLDGWTAWVYLSPDSEEPYIKIETIP